MSRQSKHQLGWMLTTAILICLTHSVGARAASDDDVDATPSVVTESRSLSELGIAFEEAKLLSADARRQDLLSLEAPIQNLLDSKLEDAQRAAGLFLEAELEDALQLPDTARELFEEAAEKGKKGPFSDDADFAAIRAREAAGRDAEAIEQWAKWEREYSKSPLLSEAKVCQVWNHLRRGDQTAAQKTLDQLVNDSPWMSHAPQVILAHATLSYMDGDFEGSLNTLATLSMQSAQSTYLKALSYDAQHEVLRAAAAYQEVYERYPDSPLRDQALYGKANTFLNGDAYRSAAEEFARVAETSSDPELQAEALLRQGAALYEEGSLSEAAPVLQDLVARFPDLDASARGQFLLGEISMSQDDPEAAIAEYNRVLRNYFEHSVASSAQYRIGRCYEKLGRKQEAVTAYETVVRGYPLEAEAPPAAYLAGVGFLEMDRPLSAAPYFQLVLDRYAQLDPDSGVVVFANDAQKEVVEAALCLLLYAYHSAGDLGQLSGAPHLILQKMPPSETSWRAYALLIDADALAAQGRFEEAEALLLSLQEEFPGHEIELPATQLLAWSYAQQGQDELAIETERRMLQRFAPDGASDSIASAYLRMAHVYFNQKRHADAVEIYEEFRYRYPESPQYALATYQAGVCYSRLDRTGDAVDRWEELVALQPGAPVSEMAWARAGDLYFRSGHYEDAKRCYLGLLTNFQGSSAGATGMLRMAQCDYNAGRDADALRGYSTVIEQYPYTMSAKEAERGMELALYRLGQNEAGGEVLTELIEKYPNSSFAADAQFQIASGLYEAGNYPEAAEAFRRVVSRFPSYDAVDRAQFLTGEAWSQAGDTNQSIQAYQQFLIFFPESELRTTVQFRLGLMLFENEDYMGAAVKFTAVVDQPDDEELHRAALFNLATAQQLMGDAEGSRGNLELYRSEYPNDERSLEIALQLGNLFESTGDWAGAAREYQTAIDAGIDIEFISEILYRLGQCREYQSDMDGALAAYEDAMESGADRDPYRLSAIARSAAIYEDREDYVHALAAYRDLIRNADDPELIAVAQGRADELEAVIR